MYGSKVATGAVLLRVDVVQAAVFLIIPLDSVSELFAKDSVGNFYKVQTDAVVFELVPAVLAVFIVVFKHVSNRLHVLFGGERKSDLFQRTAFSLHILKQVLGMQ